jgi:hypothetical protein
MQIYTQIQIHTYLLRVCILTEYYVSRYLVASGLVLKCSATTRDKADTSNEQPEQTNPRDQEEWKPKAIPTLFSRDSVTNGCWVATDLQRSQRKDRSGMMQAGSRTCMDGVCMCRMYFVDTVGSQMPLLQRRSSAVGGPCSTWLAVMTLFPSSPLPSRKKKLGQWF